MLSHLRSNLFSWVWKGGVGVKGGVGRRRVRDLVTHVCSKQLSPSDGSDRWCFVSWLKCVDRIQTWPCPWGRTIWVSMVYYIISYIKKISWSLSLHLSIFLSLPPPGLRHIRSFHQTSVKWKNIRGMWKNKPKPFVYMKGNCLLEDCSLSCNHHFLTLETFFYSRWCISNWCET